MNNDEKSLNSMPTMADPNGGARRPAKPFDEHSIGSAPTMGGRTTPQGGRLRPGDVLLGRYTVLAELGEGGMGVVYKCLDTIGGIEVAIKCLPPELSRNESEMEGIRENYAIVARLHHSAISGLRQLEKDSEFGEYYLVMDLAKGEDLSTILRRRRGTPMPLDEALAILRPLASALDYAHGEHVLHRDVKPGNVKVETLPAEASRPLTKEEVRRTKDEGTGWGERPTDQLATDQLITGGRAASPRVRVQLLDFGLAAEVRSSMSRVSLRGHAGSSGTPAYMAPEQWEARRQSAATDQYSLAVMAYQMLAGSLPFDTDNMELLKSAVLTRAPEEIEGLPAHVNAALQKALAKNPKERFASCAEFVDCLANGIFNAKPQRTQSPQSQEDGRADLRVGREVTGGPRFVAAEATHGGRDGARPSPASAVSEADVLRRKLALTRALKSISTEDRADNEFAKFVGKAEEELAVAEEACKFGRFGAADESLNAAETALDDLKKAKQAREEAERKAREEAERQAREEAERKSREEERKAREEAERKSREEAERKAREEVERKAREEVERKAREEAERKAREEVERKARLEAGRRAWQEARREEAERKVREAAEQKAREEAARRAWKEARRKAKEEVREEAERKAREETEHNREVNTVRRGHPSTLAILLAICFVIVGIVAVGKNREARRARNEAIRIAAEQAERQRIALEQAEAERQRKEAEAKRLAQAEAERKLFAERKVAEAREKEAARVEAERREKEREEREGSERKTGERGNVQVENASSSAIESQEPPLVEVIVDSDGAIWMGGAVSSVAEVGMACKMQAEALRETPVHLKVDRNLKHKDLMPVIEAISEAGVKMVVLTGDKED